MDKNIVSTDRVDIPIGSVLSKLHMDKKGKKPDLIDRIETIHKEAMAAAKPVALYAPFKPDTKDDVIHINGIEFREPFVYKMLSECELVVPYVASCGQEMDEWSQSFSDNLFERFVADAIKEMCLDVIRDKLVAEVQGKYFDSDKSISSINPGSLNKWPVTGQKPLFSVLGGVTDDIGVELASSMMMLPTKSVSGIFFQKDKEFHNCQLCPRVNCPGRKAPYEGE